jgi:homoserine/homoserine lactone efflux protein
VSHAITHGRGAVLPLATGVMLGDLTAMTCSLLGLGAVLAASAALFSVLKWMGAAYLIYLGIKLWKGGSKIGEIRIPTSTGPTPSLLKSAFIVTALNPKSIAFFVAFLPQFVDPGGKKPQQLFILGATFIVLAFINAALYALFAGHFREKLKNPGIVQWVNRCGGTALIGAGVITAAMRR